MPSIISAGTTANTGLNLTADTSGNLVFQTNGNTTAMTIDTSQNVTFANNVTYTGTITATNLVASANSNAATFTSGLGNASAPAFRFTGDTNTGIFSPTADTIAFTEGGVESMRIDSSGNVGIGVTSPAQKLDISGSARLTFAGGNNYVEFESASNYVGRNSSGNMILNAAGGNNVLQSIGGTTITQATGAGLFQFNSGYGSVATAYGCRAWVKFNGVGTVAINGSGNVSSITDNGTGDYTVNFTTAMPDTNYAFIGSAARDNTVDTLICGPRGNASTYSTSAVRISTLADAGALNDAPIVGVGIFR